MEAPHLRKPPSAKSFLEHLRRQHPLLALLQGAHHCVEAAQLWPPGR